MLPSTVTNFACFSDSHLKCIIGNETISTQTVDMFILSFNYWTNILWALVTDRLWRRVVNRVEVALARTELKDGQNWKSLHQNQLEHPESLPAIFLWSSTEGSEDMGMKPFLLPYADNLTHCPPTPTSVCFTTLTCQLGLSSDIWNNLANLVTELSYLCFIYMYMLYLRWMTY